MTKAYRLSAYLSATGAAALYWPRHDQSVALWLLEDGEITLLRYWELERISGLKHHQWPLFAPERRDQLLIELLRTEGLTLEDVGGVWGLPDLGDSSAIVELAGRHSVSVHSLGHLFSCLLMSAKEFREETMIALAIDGGPDFVLENGNPPYWYSGAVVRNGELHIRPIQSPGLLYTAATMVFGQEPGTLMAATSICGCRADLESLAKSALASITFFGGRDGGWAKALSLLTAAVDEGRRLSAAGSIGSCGEDRLQPHEHIRTVVMRRVQEIAEQIAVENIHTLAREFDIDTSQAYLGMSGGSALNCPTNSRLLAEFSFRGLRCPPSANDGGQALGLGLAGFYTEGTLPEADFEFGTPYLGAEDPGLAAAVAIYRCSIAAVSPFDEQQFVDDIEAGALAWVDGASEIGPRALGHRSLLADPRTVASKDDLNRYKQRQWWRPVAPIVLESEVAEWFEDGHRSPYMLEVFDIRPSRRDEIPAVAHLDGSARLQSLAEHDDPRLHSAITAFFERTGVPMLCNTSLNARGEPIIQTATQAVEFCLAKGLRVLYVDGQRIQLDLDVVLTSDLPTVPGPRHRELFAGQEDDRDAIWRDLEAREIDVDLIAIIARAPHLASALDRPASRRKLQALVDRARRDDPAWAAYIEHLHKAYGPESSFEAAFSNDGSSEETLLPLVAELMQRNDRAGQ